MSIFSTQKHPSYYRISLLLIVSTIFIVVLLSDYSQDIFGLFGNKEKVEALVERSGYFAPFVFVLLQIVQVLIAPLPGQVTGVVGGYLFGVFWGTVLSLLGAFIGFYIIIKITRKYGLPFVKKYVSKKKYRHFDYLSRKDGPKAFFILFLLPSFPDDILCFLAGLTKIRISKLLFISMLGRVPGYFVLSYIGAMGREGNTVQIVTILVLVAVMSIILYSSHERIESFAKKL